MFVVLFSILIFGERLNAYQWIGVVLVILSMLLLSLSSKNEGIHFTRDKGVLYMALAVLSGVGSALLDKLILGQPVHNPDNGHRHVHYVAQGQGILPGT